MSTATLSGNMTSTDALADKEFAQIEGKRAAAAAAAAPEEETCPDPSVCDPSPVPDIPIPARADCEKNGSYVGDKHPVEFISDPPANGHADANGANGTTAEDGKHEEGAKNGCHSSESVATGYETNGKDTETKSDKDCQGEAPVDAHADDNGDLCENREATGCTGENGAKCQGNTDCGADFKDNKENLNGVQGQSNSEGQSNQDCGAESQDKNGEVNGAENKIPLDKDVAVETESTNDAKHEENTDEAKAKGGENNQKCEQYNKESEITNNEKQEESNMSIDNDGDSEAAIDSAGKASTPTITITEAEPAKEGEVDEVQAKKSVAESKPEESAAEAKPDDRNPASKVEESFADSKPDAE